jgi:hypothetical protein
MIPRPMLVRALLRLYPTAWRAEYGDELIAILTARPLTPRIAADVAWNGFVQRARVAAPSTILGVAAMLFVLGNVVLSATVYRGAFAPMRPTFMTFPTIAVWFLTSEVYIVLMIVCGFWTQQRYGRGRKRSGWAAMRMSLIAGMPVVVVGLLFAAGAIDVRFMTNSELRPSTLALITAALSRVPESWLWGVLGGHIACKVGRAFTRVKA